ncbi:hypothetical protein HK405_007432 [Cladochytrium tenue]|nr:hypothetical protein HK405_007432 [Cladochytrium tenue]
MLAARDADAAATPSLPLVDNDNDQLLRDAYPGQVAYFFIGPVAAYTLFDPESATFTYVVVDRDSRDAVVIDPVLKYDLVTGKITTQAADAILQWAEAARVRIVRIFETHCHADHLTASAYIKARLGGSVPVGIGAGIVRVQATMKEKYHLDDLATDGSQFDVLLEEGDRFSFGSSTLAVLHTPGHTPDSCSFVVNDQLAFVGDVIFQPDVGSARVDFPGGSSEALYHSVTAKLFGLPADAVLFVGHDYPPVKPAASVDPLPTSAVVLTPPPPAPTAAQAGAAAPPRAPQAFSTVAHQRAANPHFLRDHDDFKTWRDQRDRSLGQPRLLHASLQCNLRAGRLPTGAQAFFKTPIQADFTL